jgi:hypothetical protein
MVARMQRTAVQTVTSLLYTLCGHESEGVPHGCSGRPAEDMAVAFKASGLPVTVIKPEFKKVYELTK